MTWTKYEDGTYCFDVACGEDNREVDVPDEIVEAIRAEAVTEVSASVRHIHRRQCEACWETNRDCAHATQPDMPADWFGPARPLPWYCWECSCLYPCPTIVALDALGKGTT